MSRRRYRSTPDRDLTKGLALAHLSTSEVAGPAAQPQMALDIDSERFIELVIERVASLG